MNIRFRNGKNLPLETIEGRSFAKVNERKKEESVRSKFAKLSMEERDEKEEAREAEKGVFDRAPPNDLENRRKKTSRILWPRDE